MNELNNELRNTAIDAGLCNVWQNDWSVDKTPEELIEMYKRGIDFCIKHDYPTLDYIKNNFPRKLLNDNLIFVDERIDFGNKELPSGVWVINGSCTGTLIFNRWAAATVYVRHNSNVTIVADGSARVFVRVMDNAEVETSTRLGGKIALRDLRLNKVK
jgi:hypothetical protein